MSIGQDQGASLCPHCKSAYEIAAVKFNALRTTSMLFVCASCALTRVDAPGPKPKRPSWFRRGTLALVIAAPVAVCVALWLFVADAQPLPSGKLATYIQRGDHIGSPAFAPM